MAKIILGKRPKHFKRTLKVELPEGEEGTIELQYVYRTRSEFGAFVDKMMAKATAIAKAELQAAAEFVKAQSDQVDAEQSAPAAPGAGDHQSLSRDANADYIMGIVDGWNLDAPFERESVVQLCDELPGVAMAIMTDYRAAITEGRLGN